MWLQLTQLEGNEPININFNLVEAYGTNDSGSYINVSNASYNVKETSTAIEALLSKKSGWQ